ncbi:hypothetical protein V5799_015504 [Amblyomma americanum]|uniref:Uncharacterized protein n=1 Tax=Amblyomma americanum TaxID=6943 RepID=A0AAQ4F7L6_AMBAM
MNEQRRETEITRRPRCKHSRCLSLHARVDITPARKAAQSARHLVARKKRTLCLRRARKRHLVGRTGHSAA